MKRFSIALLLLLATALPAAAQEYPIYQACTPAQAVTAAADMLHLEAGPVNAVYVWKVWIVPGTQTTAGYQQVVLRRTSTASTGGATVTAAPNDQNYAAFTGVVRSAATGGGTNDVTLVNSSYWAPTATTIGQSNPLVLFDSTGLTKRDAIRIAPGGTTGLELNNATGGAGGANHYACVIFSEEIR